MSNTPSTTSAGACFVRVDPGRGRAPGRMRIMMAAAAVAGAGVVAMMGGCGGETSALETTYTQAGTPGKGPAAAAVTLRTQFYTQQITAVGALNLAHDRLEKNNDAASLDFAEAVLTFLDQIEPDIDREKVNEFFWMRIGTLAANAAAKARTGEDQAAATARARALVLAGPERWQTDGYWQQNPAHDALASLLMYENGEGGAAAARLKDRPQLAEEPAAALAEIEKGMKKGGGRK